MDSATKCIIIFVILAAITVFFAIRSFLERQKQRDLALEATRQKVSQENAYLYAIFPHVSGLPFASDTPCEVYWCRYKVMFKANHQSYNLDYDQLTDVSIQTVTDTETFYISDTGKAILGNALFGPIGGAIGGRVQEKTVTKIVGRYLVFVYKQKNSTEVRTILLKASGASFMQNGFYEPHVSASNAFVEAFHALNKTPETFDL